MSRDFLYLLQDEGALNKTYTPMFVKKLSYTICFTPDAISYYNRRGVGWIVCQYSCCFYTQ